MSTSDEKRTEGPPLLSAYKADVAENYRQIAVALGLRERATATELAAGAQKLSDDLRAMAEDRDTMRKRAQAYEEALNEIADFLGQPRPKWTEGEGVWALGLWRYINGLQDRLKVAEANDFITAENLQGVMREHEKALENVEQRVKIKLAKRRLTILRLRRDIRELQYQIELLNGTLEARAEGWEHYQEQLARIRAALNMLWGDEDFGRFQEMFDRGATEDELLAWMLERGNG